MCTLPQHKKHSLNEQTKGHLNGARAGPPPHHLFSSTITVPHGHPRTHNLGAPGCGSGQLNRFSVSACCTPGAIQGAGDGRGAERAIESARSQLSGRRMPSGHSCPRPTSGRLVPQLAGSGPPAPCSSHHMCFPVRISLLERQSLFLNSLPRRPGGGW